ncbi:type II toxin-antitoxin system HicA family toxin [Methylobacterium sp. JK268]
MPPRDFELDLQTIRRRLEREGWQIAKAAGRHDVYKHPVKPGHIPVSRGRGEIPVGTARSIARAAGWIR